MMQLSHAAKKRLRIKIMQRKEESERKTDVRLHHMIDITQYLDHAQIVSLETERHHAQLENV